MLKWIINPFFAYPWNEVTAVPINVTLSAPHTVPLPRRIVETIIARASDIFILDTCICRGLEKCKNHPPEIGCMALGKAARRMHPSHGHHATKEEACAHARKRTRTYGVTSDDPLAFGLPDFNRLMFICFCDDCCCLYRTHMQKRGPALNRAYIPLPGASISVNTQLCDGCGICADRCFAAEMKIVNGVAHPGNDCKCCGRCVELCPQGALSLTFDAIGREANDGKD